MAMELSNFLLKIPSLYTFYQFLVGGSKARSTYIKEYVRPREGDAVLDIGCGPGDILKYLPTVQYLGLDTDPVYIKAALRRFSKRGKFLCGKMTRKIIEENSDFNIMLLTGLIHHLPDDEACELLEICRLGLKPDGKLFTFDGCLMDGLPHYSRLLLLNDRGKYVRTEEQYMFLASRVFKRIKKIIRNDLMRITYPIIILECSP